MNKEKLLYYEQRLKTLPGPIQASIMAGLADYYFYKDRKKSLAYANSIISTYNEPRSTPYILSLLVAHFLKGEDALTDQEYTKSLENLYQAEDYSLKLDQQTLLNKIHLGIGRVYLNNQDFKSAEHYLYLSFNEPNSSADKHATRTKVLRSLSDLYIALENIDSAILFSKKYIESTSLNNKEDIARGYHNLSRTYILKNDFNNAISNANKGLRFLTAYPNRDYETKLRLDLAYANILAHRYEHAIQHFRKAGELVDSAKYARAKIDYYSIGARLYEEYGDTSLALGFYKKLIISSEKSLVLQQKITVRNLQKQHFIHQQSKQIINLLETNTSKEKNLKKNKLWLFYITFLAILLVVTFATIFYMQREKYRNRRIISAQRAELTKKQYLEELQDVELKAAKAHIEGQERERERLARELHDGIGGTLAGIKMELESYMGQKKNTGHLSKISDLVVSTYKEVRAISHNFAIPDLMKGNYHDNLKNMIHNIPGKNGLHIQLSIYQNISWNEVESNIKIELYRIIQESVTNIIKHAEASNAEIQIVEDEGNLNVTIEDDGKGFNLAGTKKGIGLKNLRSRTAVLKGKFEIDTTPGNGTFLYFNIPLIVN